MSCFEDETAEGPKACGSLLKYLRAILPYRERSVRQACDDNLSSYLRAFTRQVRRSVVVHVQATHVYNL